MKHWFLGLFVAIVCAVGCQAQAVACTESQIDINGTCVNGKFAVQTTELNDNDTFSFSLAAGGEFTVNCGTDGILSSAANDVSGNTISRGDTVTETVYTCTYSTGGEKIIIFDGISNGTYDENADYSTQRVIGFSSYAGGTPTKIASIYGNLSSMFPVSGVTGPRFYHTFDGASNLTTVPDTLFADYTAARSYMFHGTFQNTGLTSIPGTLFSRITSANTYAFQLTFAYCPGLTSIPGTLFSGIKTINSEGVFASTFQDSGLTSIPENLFSGITGKLAYYGFNGTFKNCTGLTSIPENLFSGFTQSARYAFANLFNGCSNLSGYIPPSTFSGLIDNGSPVTSYMWTYAFLGTKLATSCDGFPGKVQYFTGYEGTDTDTYNKWNGKVSCIDAADVSKTLTLNTSNADTSVVPNTVNLAYNMGWYDETTTPATTITRLTTLPTKTNNVLDGFYTGENGVGTQVIDTNGDFTTNTPPVANTDALYAKWTACSACSAENATCSLSVVNNTCTYTTTCESGYGNIQNNGAYNASCSANSYGITYTMNGGTNYDNAPTTYTYGTGATINGTPTKSGYTFVGWCTDAELTTCAATQTIGINEMGDKTFYAKWGIGYNITYIMNDGTNYNNAPTTYAYGMGVTINGTPTRSGYTFVGWCTDSELENCAMSQTIGTDATGDKTFYAKWAEFVAKFSLTTTSVSSFRFKISAIGTFYVDCGDGGTLTSSVGDVSGNTITRSDTTIATYTCTWESAGAHTIGFDGLATGYSSITNNADGAAISFNTQTDTGNAYSNAVASISGSLGAIFPTLGSSDTQQPMFYGTFKQCRSLTSIPAGLFSGITGTRASMFRETFDRCSSLVNVPESLFSGITGAGRDSLFRSTFNETAMTAVPENLFAGVTSAGSNMFRYLFGNVTTLSGYIPPSTFAGLIANGSPTANNIWDSSFIGTNLATSCEDFPNTEQYITHYEGEGKTTWNGKVSCQSTLRYNVTYDCDTGVGTAPIDSTDYAPNATVTTLENICTPPTHKLFNKWSCGGDDVAVGGTFTITDDTTCIAQYINGLIVTYDCDGGTGSVPEDNAGYVSGETVTTLASTCTPPANKLFDKWSCGGDDITVGGTFTITDDTTCTAQYADILSVTYDCDGGTGNAPVDNAGYVSGETVTTLANTCTPPTDEYFTRWSCGGNNVNAGATFTITADTTCTAQYGTSFHVSYICGDGTGNAPVDSASYVPGATVTTATVANTACVRNGYTFTGWSCDGNAVAAGGTFTLTNSTVCTAQYTQCPACTTSHASCVINTVNNVCTYTTACESGYTNIQNNGQPNASCVLASSCTGATYEDNNACVTCPYNYGYNTENGKVVVTQCQAHCVGGTTMSNYTQLEYLENSGNTSSGQFFNTGHTIANGADVRVEMGFGTAVTRNDTSDYGNLFGNQITGGGFSASYKKGVLGIWHENSQSATPGKLSLNLKPMTADVQYDLVVTLNDTTHAKEASITSGGVEIVSDNNSGSVASTPGTTFHVFSNGGATLNNETGNIDFLNGDKLFNRGRIYYLKLYENDTLVLDLIPARRNSDNVLGLYNNVNGEFYTNVGTGTFTVGATVGTFAGGACTNVGDGYYIAENTVNYGSAAPSSNQCPNGAATNKQNASSIMECVGYTPVTYDVTYSCGDGVGNAPTGTTVAEGGDFTPSTNTCTRVGYIFTGWGVSDTEDIKPAGVAFTWEYETDKTLTAQWSQCPACATINASCELSVVNNVCTYTTACTAGYENIQNNGAYNASCSAISCSDGYTVRNGLCEPNVFNITWLGTEAGDISVNNASSTTYGGDIRTPFKAIERPGEQFVGWKFRKVSQ